MSASEVRAIQRYYPQIYFACHVDHVRQASTPHGLSSHDSGLLSHLDEGRSTTPTLLARHLGISASTLSAHLDRLVRLGYVLRSRNGTDRRRWELRLTRRSAEAMAATSVLDGPRIRKVLARLSKRERLRALEGMALLARASREAGDDKGTVR
jgi:DNA-binding MarR family transcriptional regulator